MQNIVLKSNGDKFLIVRAKEHKFYEFVVCSYYDIETDSWYSGHYFEELDGALKYFNKEE